MFRSFLDDDPFFRSTMGNMDDMMMMGMPRMNTGHTSGRRNTEPHNMAISPLSPFGMFGGGMFGGGLLGGMGSMMRDMENNMRMMQHSAGAPGSSFQSSYTSVSYGGGGGQPRVYQSSSSTKIGPHGAKETQKTERDSTTGLHTMAIGHHIGERSHVIEKSKNARTGEEEESQEFVNLEEDEADKFNQEFQQRVRRAPISHRGIAHQHSRRPSPYGQRRPEPAAIEYYHPSPRSHRSQRARDYQ